MRGEYCLSGFLFYSPPSGVRKGASSRLNSPTSSEPMSSAGHTFRYAIHIPSTSSAHHPDPMGRGFSSFPHILFPSTTLTGNSGYVLNSHAIDLTALGVISSACWSEIGAIPSASSTLETTGPSSSEATVTGMALNTIFPNGVAVHNAYQIYWEASDVPNLSPTPPNISCDGILSTWVPGESVVASTCPDYTNVTEHPHLEGVGFLMIGLPIICGLLILACFGCCFYHSRNNRRERRLAITAAPSRAERTEQTDNLS